jgi:hypothetical protein
MKFSHIKTKGELKKNFINTYENIRGDCIDIIGIPLYNVDSVICYFITSFNFISRLQYIMEREH